jgi:hypothetical protein
MRKGVCPKCGSQSVYLMENGIGAAEFQYIRGVGFGMSSTDFECYLCTACGYFENYVNRRKHLEKIERKGEWKRVLPGPGEPTLP